MPRILCIFLFFFLTRTSLIAKDFLTEKETHYAIEELLAYHVEFKEFSSQLAKRSFKLFFTQFDPYKIYLLQSEISFFTEMGEKDLQDVVKNHTKKQYPRYKEAHNLIHNAILRARQYRKIIAKEFLQKGLSYEALEDQNLYFPKTELSLQHRIKKHLFYMIQSEKKQENLDTLSLEDLKKILDLQERKFQELENPYLSSEEHFFCMKTLKAFAKSLDAHTSFFSKQEALELRTNLEKQFEGIGIVVKESIKGLIIKEVLANSPAEKCGQISPGDLLLSVNNKSTAHVSYAEVLEWLKGEKKAKISLVLQKKTGNTLSVTLLKEKMIVQRDLLQFTSIPFANGLIGIIEIPSFYESDTGPNCEKDVKEALARLKLQGNLLGLILDMRNNSGGFLSQAVKIASLFISNGVIVISKYAQGQMQYLRDINGKIFYQGPLVILTSKASASATEIVAQALQDYGIALIVGDERTFGKGTIQYQTVTEEDSQSHFKVTVGKYYTVSGQSTQIEGVKADILVPTSYSPFNIGEKYLPYALKNDQVPSAFIDPLIGIDGYKKSWLQKNYLPNLQKKLSYWTEMIPTLKINSEYRLQHNQNFLCFLQMLENDTVSWDQEKKKNLGTEDLQIHEAVQIIKDMNLLQKYKKNSDYLRK